MFDVIRNRQLLLPVVSSIQTVIKWSGNKVAPKTFDHKTVIICCTTARARKIVLAFKMELIIG